MNTRMVPDADGSGGRHAETCDCDASRLLTELRAVLYPARPTDVSHTAMQAVNARAILNRAVQGVTT